MELTKRPKALVTAPFRGYGLERLKELADVILDPWISGSHLRMYNAEQLAERVEEEGCNIVICEADVCAGPLFSLPLLVVGSTRGDPTNVVIPDATAARVPVLRAPGRNADGVAELVIGLIIASTRRIIPADRDVREAQVFRDGTIPYQRFRSWQIAGRRAGLIGFGAVARALAWRLKGLGLDVIAYDPYAPEAKNSLDEVIETSDIISVHAPLTPDTDGMIDAGKFANMKDGVVFINTARARLHDMDALVDALASGKVAAAGLDHFEGEQLPEGHPLCSMDNVVLAPHIGGATYDTEANHSRLIADDITLLLAGEMPRNCVNPEVLDVHGSGVQHEPMKGN
jgi:D-3-phosphoglycerate dehydrogenase